MDTGAGQDLIEGRVLSSSSGSAERPWNAGGGALSARRASVAGRSLLRRVVASVIVNNHRHRGRHPHILSVANLEVLGAVLKPSRNLAVLENINMTVLFLAPAAVIDTSPQLEPETGTDCWCPQR